VRRRIPILLTALLVALPAVGCRSEAYKNAILTRAKALQATPEYRIGEGDAITVRVIGHPEFDVDGVLVRPDGKISFPSLGDVEVATKTTEEVRRDMEDALGKDLRNPKVFVSANAFNSKFVTVLGQVQVPGRYPYRGQTRITDLLGQAIGETEIHSAPNRALLFRDLEGATKVYRVELKNFWEKADFSTNYYVQPGDVLYIPRNGFSELYMAISKVLLPVRAITEAVGIGNTTASIFVPGYGGPAAP